MKDNLFERLTDLSIGTGSKTPMAAIERIKLLVTEQEELKEQIKAAERVGDALAGAGTVEQRHARAIRELIYYRNKYGKDKTCL